MPSETKDLDASETAVRLASLPNPQECRSFAEEADLKGSLLGSLHKRSRQPQRDPTRGPSLPCTAEGLLVRARETGENQGSQEPRLVAQAARAGDGAPTVRADFRNETCDEMRVV
jgi:hypothetical protein